LYGAAATLEVPFVRAGAMGSTLTTTIKGAQLSSLSLPLVDAVVLVHASTPAMQRT
jgi:hypothetical protein